MKNTVSWRWPEVALLIVIISLLTLIAAVLASRYLPIPFSNEVSPADTESSGTITTDSFTTAFTLADNTALAIQSYQEHLLFRVVLPLAVGIIGFLYAGTFLIYSLLFKLRPKRAISMAGGAGIILWIGLGGLNLLNATDAQHVSNCARLQNIYDSQQYRITEGIVHVSHVQPASGHAKGDIFTVGNVGFEVSHFASYCAYGKTIAYGGPLTEGTYARIYYTDYRTILRIDVKKQ